MEDEATMANVLIIIGIAIIIFQLAAQRILLVALVKQVRMATIMMEQDLGFDAEGAAEDAQREIDIAAGKYR
jgi:hypothetical protein